MLFVADHGEHADYLKANLIQQYGGAHRGSPRKQLARDLAPQKTDPAALQIVLVIDPTTDLHGDGSHFAINGKYAGNQAIGAGVVADHPNVIPRDHRRNVYHELGLVLDGSVIFKSQVEPPHGSETALDCRRAATPEENDVFAEGLQLPPVAAAEAFTNAACVPTVRVRSDRKCPRACAPVCPKRAAISTVVVTILLKRILTSDCSYCVCNVGGNDGAPSWRAVVQFPRR